MLWLHSFIETGEINDEDDAENVYSRISLFWIPFIVASLILSGMLSDCVQPYKIFIPGLLCHVLACFSMLYINQPKSDLACFLMTLIGSSAVFTVVSLESLFMKSLPGNVRGAMSIILTLMQSVVYLIFNYFAGKMFDSMGPTAPFLLWSALSMFYFFIGIILVLFGQLRAEEQNQQTEMDSKAYDCEKEEDPLNQNHEHTKKGIEI